METLKALKNELCKDNVKLLYNNKVVSNVRPEEKLIFLKDDIIDFEELTDEEIEFAIIKNCRFYQEYTPDFLND